MVHNGSHTYDYFFWIVSPIKMKFGQILVCCMTSISKMFLVECWRLETSSRLFNDFIKMAIQQDLAIFNGWRVPSLIVLYSPFWKTEHWTLDIFSYWVIGAGCWIKKELEFSPSPPNCSKHNWKLFSLLITIKSIHGGEHWGIKMLSKKYLWRSSFDSKIAGYKPASLQIY